MSRTRNLGYNLNSRCSWQYTAHTLDREKRLDGGGVIHTGNTVPDTFTSVMTDVVTPNFKARIKKGEIINNPASLEEKTFIRPRVTPFNRYRVYITGYRDGGPLYSGNFYEGDQAMDESYLGDYLGHSEGVGEAIDIAIARAVTSAHANASSTEFQSLVFAAESCKSVHAMSSILYRVFKIAKAVKRLDGKYLKSQISKKELQNRYMELRYAIRPLVYDARDIVAAVGKTKRYNKTRFTARGFERVHDENSDTITLHPWSTWEHKVNRTTHLEVNIRAGILCDVDISPMNIWGVDQPLETLWEITPFSFIIDWFINVGDTLAAWTPDAGVTQLASWVTVETNITQTNRSGSCTNINPSGRDYIANFFNWGGSKAAVSRKISRTINPPLSAYPRVSLRLDVLKLVDLGIILKRFR